MDMLKKLYKFSDIFRDSVIYSANMLQKGNFVQNIARVWKRYFQRSILR